jgi:DNA transformation protein
MAGVEIANAKNIGPKSAEWLRRAGIATLADLQRRGAPATFLAIKQAGHRPSLNLLWALAGALRDKHWMTLTAAEKAEVTDELRQLTGN